SQLSLDLVVFDDASGFGVDQEHPARLQPSFADDPALVHFEHADFTGQHDEPVFGDPVASRTQTVAVEHGADLGAIGERHQRRAATGSPKTGSSCWPVK